MALSRRQFLTTSALSAAALSVPRLAAAPTPERDANPIVAGNNQFNTELYAQLATKPGNVFFSALSMQAAFGMCAAGAKGKTLAEMQKVFHFPQEMANTHSGFEKLMALLNNEKVPAAERGFELAIANALWGSSSYPWNKDYIKLISTQYDSALFDTDFANPEPARKRINQWVETQTREKIKDLLPQGSITNLTRLVLTNAIYFKGKWEREFDKKLTKPQAFWNADGNSQDVPMMVRSASFAYSESDKVQMVELPYRGNETSMLIVLPKKKGGLKEVERSITSTVLDELIKNLQRTSVNVTLPRFKIETKYDLGNVLRTMGIITAFTPDADFTGMHSSPEKLYITSAVHKAFVDVNEEGTEAAAATGIVVGRASVSIPKVFTANHPFLFAIRHVPTNTLLFFGKHEKCQAG
jgi:serpin B